MGKPLSGGEESMWPFSKGRSVRERDFIRAAFARYMSPVLIEKLSKAPLSATFPRKGAGFSSRCSKIRVTMTRLVLAERLKRHSVDIAGEAQGMINFMPPFLLVILVFR